MQNLVAAQSGDHFKALVELRDSLAAAMDLASPNMVPQIAGQYRATLAEIAALPTGAKAVKKGRDEFTQRRADRIADAEAVPAPGRSGRKRG